MSSSADRRRAELRALTELGGTELDSAVSGIHDLHRAISDRTFATARRGVGPAVTPIRVVSDGIRDGVYATIGTAFRAAARVADTVADLAVGPPPSETRSGASVIGAVLGLIGDNLERDGSPLAADPMTIRMDGRVVDLDDGPTAEGRLDPQVVLTGATDRVVVFLHGLCETEHAWGGSGSEPEDFGARLAADLDVTPIYVRYNSGRHISSNGAALAELLERVLGTWPVPITDIALIGHSMGGLVARSAAHQARLAEMDWPTQVSATVSLGTPHLGAPLEQAAHYGSAAPVAFPETAALGRLLRRRSAGIRDLREGSIVDEDWRDRDVDALGKAVLAEVELLPNAAHYFVTASVTREADHLLGRLLGDGLVLPPSAAGNHRARRIGFAEDMGTHLGNTSHLALLRSDAVYSRLREWLAPSSGPSS